MLLLSPGNVVDYVTHIYKKYAIVDGSNIAELADLAGQKLHSSTSYTNYS